MQRNRFDRAAKDMLRDSLSPDGNFESDAEVSPDTQRADVWFTPDPARPPTRADLGLLGRMTLGACTLEPFHATPGENEVSGCVRKLLNFRHVLSLRSPTPPLPKLWIISAGRPDAGIEGFAFQAVEGWPTGVYHSPRLLYGGVVVTSELPRGRDTLLLRLMGAGACLRGALVELAALPIETREHAIAAPVLLRYRIEIAKEPDTPTHEDEEFMTDTQEIYETWKREAEAVGLTKGLAKGLVAMYEVRFGTMPPELKKAVEATEEEAPLLAWIRLLETSSRETFAATVHASRTG
jgi:hypothetical protein